MINVAITPLLEFYNPIVTHLFSAIYMGYITPFTTSRGPILQVVWLIFSEASTSISPGFAQQNLICLFDGVAMKTTLPGT